MPAHERFFECILVADRNEYRFHFRAWTPDEAEFHLRRELESWGVALPGELRVVDARGRVVLSSAYAPPSSATGLPPPR